MPINATTATADTQLNRQKSESPKKPQTIAFNNVFSHDYSMGKKHAKWPVDDARVGLPYYV